MNSACSLCAAHSGGLNLNKGAQYTLHLELHYRENKCRMLRKMMCYGKEKMAPKLSYCNMMYKARQLPGSCMVTLIQTSILKLQQCFTSGPLLAVLLHDTKESIVYRQDRLSDEISTSAAHARSSSF